MPALKKIPKRLWSAPGAGALLMAVGLAAAFYFRLEAQSEAMGEKIKSLERDLEEISRDYTREIAKWENMNSAASIEQALARHGVAMVWPKAAAVVRLPDPASFPALREASEYQAEGRVASAPFGASKSFKD